MSARRLPEAIVLMIENQIRTNIAAALQAVRDDRAPNKAVQTPKPLSYFHYEGASGYKTPAVFIILTDIDFRNKETQANFICARARVDVAIAVDDQTMDLVVPKAWCYHDALHGVLSNQALTAPDSKLKLILEVTHSKFSALYSTAKTPGPESFFRKEVLLELEVEVYENF